MHDLIAKTVAVESDAHRAPELLCRFRKQPKPVVVLQRGAMALAQVAKAT